MPELEVFGGAMVIGELGVAGDFAGEVEHELCCGFAEAGRAVGVGGVWPERGTDDRPARRQGPPCPPDVQCRDVAMPDRLLSPRMGGDALDGQVNFDKAFGVAHRKAKG